VESGLLAARAILDARGAFTRERLAPYGAALAARFGEGAFSRTLTRWLPERTAAAAFPWMFASPWLVRRLVLDRWFLHAHEPALAD
jgi:hypothetical protein